MSENFILTNYPGETFNVAETMVCIEHFINMFFSQKTLCSFTFNLMHRVDK